MLFHKHLWQDITTPWNHLDVTHLQCTACKKVITAFEQRYKRSSHGRVEDKELYEQV